MDRWNKDTILLSSNLLGSDVIAVTPDEMTAFFENNKDTMLEGGMTEEQYQELMAQLSAMLSGSATMAGGMDLDALDMDDLDLTATMAAIQALVEDTEPVEGKLTEQPEGCDPATSVYTLTLDGEKLMTALRAAVKDMMNTAYMNAAMESMSAMIEQDGEQIDVKEQILSAYDAMSLQDDVVCTVYFDKDDEVVRVEADYTLITSDDTENPLTCRLIFNRLTQDMVSYNFDMTMTDKADESVQILGSLKQVDDDDDSFVFEMSMLVNADGETQRINFAIDCKEQEANEKTVTDLLFTLSVTEDSAEPVGIRLRMQVTEIDNETDDCTILIDVLPLEGDTSYITITITVTASETAALEKLNGTNAVHPLTMSEAELNAWAEGVTTSAQTALVSAIQLLPESVLNMVMSVMQE